MGKPKFRKSVMHLEKTIKILQDLRNMYINPSKDSMVTCPLCSLAKFRCENCVWVWTTKNTCGSWAKENSNSVSFLNLRSLSSPSLERYRHRRIRLIDKQIRWCQLRIFWYRINFEIFL
jgi:hypothetical protein